MSDRPRGEDSHDYGWLYGSGRGKNEPSSAQPSRDPEPTQVLPQVTRPGSGGTPTPAPPTPPAPPARPTPKSAQPPIPPGPRSKRRRSRWRIARLVIAAWLAFLIVVPIWAFTQITRVDITPSGARPAEQPGKNFLLVGSDSRDGLSNAEKRKLGVGGVGNVGRRTDTIMVLHTGSGPSLLLSIPRDSLVPIPGHGTNKINAAFAYGGPKLLVQTIEQNTGLRIDNYVEIGFGGFVNAIDAVGGVQICPKTAVKDRRANLNIKKGCQNADGATALAWSRSRHAFALGDVERAKHQRDVLSAVGAKVKSPWTILNPVRYFRLNQAGTTSVRISQGTGPLALAEFAWAMTRVNGSNGLTCSMPISDLAVHWDSSRALSLLRYLKRDQTAQLPKSLCTPTGLPQ